MNRHTSATDLGAEGPPQSRIGSPATDAGPAAGAPATMSCRSFLRRVGIGGATAFVLADAGVAYRGYDQGVLAEGRGPAFDAWSTWRTGIALVPSEAPELVASIRLRPGPTDGGEPYRALVGVLAVIYLAFGIVARDGIGLLGVGGAVVACVALAVRNRSRWVAAVGLALAALPFAVAAAWTVATPLTAVLMLAIGLPYVLDRSHAGSARGGSS